MLNLPQKSLIKIKKYLLRQQREVDEQLASIEKDDPMSLNNVVAEASESGTDSWLAEVHGRMSTIKEDLIDLSGRIKRSLFRLKKGIYGKCECCGKEIEPERLEAMPTATMCVICSKKKCTSKTKKH